MNTYFDPSFIAAEMAYRYDRDHVSGATRPTAQRHRLARMWRHLTHRNPA